MHYNHNRPLSDFQESIDILKAAGYKPIAVSQIYFEDTFIFETDEEAEKAYNKFEHTDCDIIGWWYGKDTFLQQVKKYEEEAHNDVKVLVHWLDNTQPL